MNPAAQMWFHEATVLRFGRQGADFELELDEVAMDGRTGRVLLMVSSVSSASVDDERLAEPHMETSVGEVLSLELSETEST